MLWVRGVPVRVVCVRARARVLGVRGRVRVRVLGVPVFVGARGRVRGCVTGAASWCRGSGLRSCVAVRVVVVCCSECGCVW